MQYKLDLPRPNLTDVIVQLVSEGESLQLEFKDDRSTSFSDTKIVEAAVAMSNAQGGRLLIGVTDHCEIVGSGKIYQGGNGWKTADALAGMIAANTIPACSPHIEVITISDKHVVVVDVPQGLTTIGTKSGKFIKRVNDARGRPSNVPMTTDDILRGTTRIGTQDFSATILSGVNLSNIDLELVERVSKQRAVQITDTHERELMNSDPQSILMAKGLLSNQSLPNIACMLLFGKPEILREKLPNHEVKYQVFGQRGDLVKNLSFVDPIAKMFPQILSLPELARNSDEFVYRGNSQVVSEYPNQSIREALANALVHRDYTLLMSTSFQVFEKEIVLLNSGGFPLGVNVSNLLSAAPNPRNRRLAEGMRAFGFAENSGRGIDFLYMGQARYGRPAPDYSASDANQVSVRLAGGQANLEFCRFILSSRTDPTISECLILNALFFRRDLTLEQCATLVQRPVTATKEILVTLQKDGLIEVTSQKNPKYLLKASASHSARKAVSPARLSNKQIEEFKIRILEELAEKSPNSLGNIADTCGISPTQARRLLRALAAEKKISMLPSRKWTIT